MKSLILSLVAAITLSSFTASADAVSCSQILQRQEKYAAELEYLRERIVTSRNSDVREVLMGQYEDAYARYIDATRDLNDRCK